MIDTLLHVCSFYFKCLFDLVMWAV